MRRKEDSLYASAPNKLFVPASQSHACSSTNVAAGSSAPHESNAHENIRHIPNERVPMHTQRAGKRGVCDGNERPMCAEGQKERTARADGHTGQSKGKGSGRGQCRQARDEDVGASHKKVAGKRARVQTCYDVA